jgi:succinate dehydrogenase / fumarate reductase iron-sulfur subunit
VAANSYTFKVFRFDPEKDKSHRFDTFEVPTFPHITVLDGLFYIQDNLDGSVAFRSSCRAGVCGSCAMHINGKYRLACETQVSLLGGSTVSIRPLAHLPIIRDIFVDMTNFWKMYKRIKPYLMPGSEHPEKERLQTADERKHIDILVDCILCSACYSSCPVVATDSDYLGPAALLKADRFLQDSRDQADEERLTIINGDHGAFRCHTIFNCQKVCPKDLDPTGAIADLKMKRIFGTK